MTTKTKSAQEILKSNEKFHINLGLKRIKAILSLLGNPQNNYKIIHIAGTNGKGSTCAIINQILIEYFGAKSDAKIGLYTSPHLFSYCERIKINNIEIRQDIFDRLINDIDLMAKKNDIFLTEFELLTTVAFYYFYIKKVDYVVLETGLGGRYDATNVAKPVLEIITTIDFDHKDRLGETINKIAFEKAGIIKENSKVIINSNNKGFEVVKKTADFKNAQLICAPEIEMENNILKYKNASYEFNLLGAHQKENLSLALCAVENILTVDNSIFNETLKKALKKVQWRFRLEYNKEKNLLIDGAHNPSGIKTLVDFLNEKFSDIEKEIVFGCLKTKDYDEMIEILFQIKNVSKFYFCEFDYPVSLKFCDLNEISQRKFDKVIKSDCENEIDKIINRKTLSVFCGSLYMNGLIFNNIKY